MRFAEEITVSGWTAIATQIETICIELQYGDYTFSRARDDILSLLRDAGIPVPVLSQSTQDMPSPTERPAYDMGGGLFREPDPPDGWQAELADPDCPHCHGTGRVEDEGGGRHYVAGGLACESVNLVDCDCVHEALGDPGFEGL